MCTNSAKFSVCDGHRARKHTTRAAEWETARGYTKLGAAGGLPAGGSLQPPIGVKDGNEVGGQEKGSEGSSPSINNKNNNNGSEEVSMGRRPGRVAGPTYEDVREVMDARERRTCPSGTMRPTSGGRRRGGPHSRRSGHILSDGWRT